MVCLAVIHGNEEKVIKRFIEQFAPAVQFMVFVRAGGDSAPDKTATIIGETCEKLDMPYVRQIYENKVPMPHVDDFGAARQKAWEIAAKTGAKYLMWADCDDTLEPEAADVIRETAERGEHDMYLMPYKVRGNSQVVMRERMVVNDGSSRWRYPIHEQLSFRREMSYRILANAVVVHSPLEDKGDVQDRNLSILDSQICDAGRYYFYIAQEFFGKKKIAKFKQFANAALNAPGLEDLERYEILLNLAQCHNGEEAKTYAQRAFGIMPDRREALALLANYAIVDGDYTKANQLARIMMGIAKPIKTYWSMNHDWYDWKGLHLWNQTQRLVGKVKEANEMEDKFFEAAGRTFSVIHATLGRVAEAICAREQWLARADNPHAVEYIYGLHSFDKTSRKFLGGFRHSLTDKKGAGPNLEAAAAISTGRVIVQAQDDILPPYHWDTLLLERLGDLIEKPSFVAVSDGHRKDRIHVTSIMTRPYMEFKAKGDCEGCGFGHPGYFSMYWDTENSYRAYRDARDGKCNLIDATDLVFFHDHPAFVKGKPWDETYKIENAPEHYDAGAKLFNERNPQASKDGIMEGK